METQLHKHFKYKYIEHDKSFSGKSRLAFALNTKGCSLAKKHSPCIYCISPESNSGVSTYFSELKQFLIKFRSNLPYKIDIVSLHCLGSFLDRREVSQKEGESVIKLFFETFKAQTITIESHPAFITTDSINWLRNLNLNCFFEIGIGFDTINDNARNNIIGKNISKQLFTCAVSTTFQSDITPVPFIVFNPPGINFKNAISEAESTAKFFSDLGIKHAWLEPVQILNESKLNMLWREGKYAIASQSDFLKAHKICSKYLSLRMGGEISSSQAVPYS